MYKRYRYESAVLGGTVTAAHGLQWPGGTLRSLSGNLQLAAPWLTAERKTVRMLRVEMAAHLKSLADSYATLLLSLYTYGLSGPVRFINPESPLATVIAQLNQTNRVVHKPQLSRQGGALWRIPEGGADLYLYGDGRCDATAELHLALTIEYEMEQ